MLKTWYRYDFFVLGDNDVPGESDEMIPSYYITTDSDILHVRSVLLYVYDDVLFLRQTPFFSCALV